MSISTWIVKVDGEEKERFTGHDAEGTAYLVADDMEENGIQPELIKVEQVEDELSPRDSLFETLTKGVIEGAAKRGIDLEANPAEHRFDENGVYDMANVGVFEYIILDEEGFPESAFSSESDVEFMVEQIQKSEGFDPIVICKCADGEYRRYEV